MNMNLVWIETYEFGMDRDMNVVVCESGQRYTDFERWFVNMVKTYELNGVWMIMNLEWIKI